MCDFCVREANLFNVLCVRKHAIVLSSVHGALCNVDRCPPKCLHVSIGCLINGPIPLTELYIEPPVNIWEFFYNLYFCTQVFFLFVFFVTQKC